MIKPSNSQLDQNYVGQLALNVRQLEVTILNLKRCWNAISGVVRKRVTPKSDCYNYNVMSVTAALPIEKSQKCTAKYKYIDSASLYLSLSVSFCQSVCVLLPTPCSPVSIAIYMYTIHIVPNLPTQKYMKRLRHEVICCSFVLNLDFSWNMGDGPTK